MYYKLLNGSEENPRPHYRQELSSNDVKGLILKEIEYRGPTMQTVDVTYEAGIVRLQMHTSLFAEQNYGKNENFFRKVLLELVDGIYREMTKYEKLKTLDIRVEHMNRIYSIRDIPLKDAKGKPLITDKSNEDNQKWLLEHLQVEEK